MSNLIDEIRTARQTLRSEENRTTEAAIELRNCKERERQARAELDALLDALEAGRDTRYPLFPAEVSGNGEPSVPTRADETDPASGVPPVRIEPPPRGRKKKGAAVP